MSTPTPRTDKTSESLLSKTFLTSYVTMQELARTLERELAAERARLDWLTMNAHVEPEEYRGGSFSEGGTLWHSWRFSSPRHAAHHASAAIDAAVKDLK